MKFAFSVCGKTALIKDNAEQSVRLRIARVGRDYLSSGCFRFFKPARLKQICSLRKFGGLTIGGPNDPAGFGASGTRRLRAKLRRCNQYCEASPS
jgi:hypothetical protein